VTVVLATFAALAALVLVARVRQRGPRKQCPKCGAWCPAAAVDCPYCDHRWALEVGTA
jgi:DNA-directed RNA polymerase subunit RPC12/RpoP